jgi:hypothetical protein
MTARSSLMFTVLALAAAGCSDVSGPNPAEQIYSAALAQWNTTGPASYDMVLKRECICTVAEIDVTIQVRDEVVTSRTYTGTGDPQDPNDDDPVEVGNQDLYPDVPGLFAIVRDAMDGDPFFLSAEYDQDFGYPSIIQLDMNASTNSDNVVYTVVSFTPVTP